MSDEEKCCPECHSDDYQELEYDDYRTYWVCWTCGISTEPKGKE